MRVRTVTTISLDKSEEIPYSLDGVDYRICVIHQPDDRKPLIYSRRVYAGGKVSTGRLRDHELPADAAEIVTHLARRWTGAQL